MISPLCPYCFPSLLPVFPYSFHITLLLHHVFAIIPYCDVSTLQDQYVKVKQPHQLINNMIIQVPIRKYLDLTLKQLSTRPLQIQ